MLTLPLAPHSLEISPEADISAVDALPLTPTPPIPALPSTYIPTLVVVVFSLYSFLPASIETSFLAIISVFLEELNVPLTILMLFPEFNSIFPPVDMLLPFDVELFFSVVVFPPPNT